MTLFLTGLEEEIMWKDPLFRQTFLLLVSFLVVLKEKVYSMNTHLNHKKERVSSQCAKTEGNANLFHRVHLNFAKRINLCLENDGNQV